jgi:TolB-like protein
MKRVWLFLFLCIYTVCSFAQENVSTLDEAINNSMIYFVNRLPKGIKLVILNFTTPTRELSEYMIEELTVAIVNDGSLTVVDRRNLELLQQEMDFQLSGEVSDATAQAIGQKLGAQTIISGSINPLGNTYRMRIQAIEVETAQIQGARTDTVLLDQTLAALLKVKYNGPIVPPRPAQGRTTGNTSRDFSTAKGIGSGFLNLGFGLGSFIIGDTAGGLTVAAGYAVGIGLIVIEVTALSYEDDLAGVPGTFGLGIAGITAAYGFIRPFIYQKNRTGNSLAGILNGLDIIIIPDKTGIKTVSLSYIHQF